MGRRAHELPPAIVIGGGANSISVARSLGSQGVKVYALCAPHDHIRYSRFAERVPFDDRSGFTESCASYLTGPDSDPLRGAVLLAACDAGIEVIAEHREALSRKFILDISNKEAQLAMLDKLATYNEAAKSGVSTPLFWPMSSRKNIFTLRSELVFPLLVKPLKSHVFRGPFPAEKFFLANDFSQLATLYDKVRRAGIDVMLVEQIPGPDDRLCSYYTYIDESGEPAFDFTKRIIRRYPVGMGLASYHVTDWNPEVKEQALRLFKAVGLRGVANAEFKRDDRDGRLKLIECNARFTASNGLLAECGIDLSLFVYYRLIGEPYPLPQRYKLNKRMWSPVRDLYALRELRRRKELTLPGWLRSVLHRQSFPYFKWYDPLPAIMVGSHEMKEVLSRRASRARTKLGRALGKPAAARR